MNSASTASHDEVPHPVLDDPHESFTGSGSRCHCLSPIVRVVTFLVEGASSARFVAYQSSSSSATFKMIYQVRNLTVVAGEQYVVVVTFAAVVAGALR